MTRHKKRGRLVPVPRKRRHPAAPAIIIPLREKSAISIEEFCSLYGFSRVFYYKLAQQGIAPKSFKLGRKRLITWRAIEKWERQRERATEEEEG